MINSLRPFEDSADFKYKVVGNNASLRLFCDPSHSGLKEMSMYWPFRLIHFAIHRTARLCCRYYCVGRIAV